MMFDDISARVADAALRGRLSWTTAEGAGASRIDGQLEADTLDVAALIAAATGMRAACRRGPELVGPIRLSTARSAISADASHSRRRRASLGPTLVASDLRGVARFGNTRIRAGRSSRPHWPTAKPKAR